MVVVVAASLAYSEHGGSPSPLVVYTPLSAQAVHAAAAGLVVPCTESDLLSCLERQPNDASLYSALAPWANYGTATIQEYAQTYYDSSPSEEAVEEADLQAAGAQTVVHELWTTTGPDQSTTDVVVVRFASAQGAQAAALADDGADLSPSGSDGFEVSIPGLPGYVYPERTPDADGYVPAEYDAAVGNLLMEVHFISLSSFDQVTFAPWAVGEYLTLQTAEQQAAPIAAVLSAATVPSMTGGSSPCTDVISCLMHVPSGATALSDSDYDDAQVVSAAQFVADKFEYESSVLTADETDALTEDQVQQIVHSAWNGAEGDEADMAVLAFGSAAQAQASALTDQGAMLDSGKPFSIKGHPDAVADEATVLYGHVHVRFVGYTGDFEVWMDYYCTGTFSAADAVSWFDTQMAELPAG